MDGPNKPRGCVFSLREGDAVKISCSFRTDRYMLLDGIEFGQNGRGVFLVMLGEKSSRLDVGLYCDPVIITEGIGVSIRKRPAGRVLTTKFFLYDGNFYVSRIKPRNVLEYFPERK